MGNYDDVMKPWIAKNYPYSKPDLCTAFMERNWELSTKNGYSAMVNMQSWMFLSSYEKLRSKVFDERTIISMVHIGPRGFDSIGGEVVSTTAFISTNVATGIYGVYVRTIDGAGEKEKKRLLAQETNHYKCLSSQFSAIPGNVVAYWVSNNFRNLFSSSCKLEDLSYPKQGLHTGNNDLYLRFWFEVDVAKIMLKDNQIWDSSSL